MQLVSAFQLTKGSTYYIDVTDNGVFDIFAQELEVAVSLRLFGSRCEELQARGGGRGWTALPTALAAAAADAAAYAELHRSAAAAAAAAAASHRRAADCKARVANVSAYPETRVSCVFPGLWHYIVYLHQQQAN